MSLGGPALKPPAVATATMAPPPVEVAQPQTAPGFKPTSTGFGSTILASALTSRTPKTAGGKSLLGL